MKTGHASNNHGLLSPAAVRLLLPVVVCLVLAMLAICLFAVPAHAAGQKIKQIQVDDQAEAVQITVAATHPIKMRVLRVSERYLAFDIDGYLCGKDRTNVSIGDGGIEGVKYGWFQAKPPVSRISVSCGGKRDYTVNYENEKRRAIIRVKKVGAKPVAAVVVEKTAAAPASTVSAPDAPTQVSVAAGPQPVVERSSVLVASVTPVVAAAPVPAPEPKKQPKISLDFVGSDIHDVLKALSMQGGVNVVAGRDVKGDVTVSLANVSVEEALALVTKMSGFSYSLENGTYVVGTRETLKSLSAEPLPTEEKQATEIVTIKYADPAAVSGMLKSRFKNLETESPGDTPRVPAMLVLSGSESVVAQGKALAEQMESSAAAVAASTIMDVYEVKYADIKDLAALVGNAIPTIRVTMGPSTGFNQKCAVPVTTSATEGGSYGGAPDTPAPPKALILHGSEEDISKARTFLDRMDVQQPQLILETKMVDIRNDASKDLGIEWDWKGVHVDELSRDPVGKSTAVNSEIASVHLGRFSRTPFEAMATIKAMIDSGKGRLLANPSVLALDGKPASIFIGDQIKYVVNIQQTPTGVNVVVETDTVGIQLHAVSRITSDGYITMNLHPEVSVITRWVNTPAGLALPEIARRFVDSTIRVKDGETIVIGGLIREEEIERMSGIPFLKDLPVLGNLFKSKSKTRNKSEIIMFITPRIVQPT